MRAVGAFLLSLVWMACTVQAQVQVQPPTRPPQTQDGGTREVLESIAIPPLADAPFSGTLVTEWTRPMADGGSYTLTNRRRIARDSAGRIYEERWLLVPKGSDIKSSMNFIQIADPVNRTLYTCSIFHKRCDLSTYRPPASAAFEDEPPPPGRSKDGAHTVENLGAKNLFGLDTIGTRQTTTIPQVLWAAIAQYRSCWSSGTPHGLVLTWNRFAPTPGRERRSSRLRNWIWSILIRSCLQFPKVIKSWTSKPIPPLRGKEIRTSRAPKLR